MNNKKEQVRDDFGGGSGAHKPTTDTKNDSRDYGKYVIIATFVVLASVAIVLAII